MKKFVLIMAGGLGKRAGDSMPKQFHKLLGIPMLWWSVLTFFRTDPTTRIFIVLHPDFFDLFYKLHKELPSILKDINVSLVPGGNTRAESVANGLKHLPDSCEALIAVHDAARPLVTENIINEAWQSAQNFMSAVPVIPVADSLRKVESGSSVAIDRSRFVAVQTPQTFRADVLHRAFILKPESYFTDEASRVEASGTNVFLIDGSPLNLKVTNPVDFDIAESILRRNPFALDVEK